MNSFSFQRWSLLVGKHWVENQKRYLLSVVAIFALLIFFFTFGLLVNSEDPLNRTWQLVGYFLGLFGVGCLFAGQFFSSLGSRAKGAYYILTPASALEKLLTALLYVVVIFFIVYTAVYYLADIIMIFIANATHPYYLNPDPEGNVPKAELVNIFYEYNWMLSEANPLHYFLLAFFAIQAAFLLGSVYFNQYSIVKTAIVLFCIFLLVMFLEGYLLHKFMPAGDHQDSIGSFVTFVNGRPDKVVELSPWLEDVLVFIAQYAFAPLLWIVTYYRVTEKEI